MMASILHSISETKHKHGCRTGRVLEVGSLDLNGSPRGVFNDAESYVGVDLTPGIGVDFLLDAERLHPFFPEGEFDTVLCFECLEHTVRPWIVAEQIKKVLKAGGTLWVSTPTYGFPLHRYPVDCYRFGEDAYRLWLFAGMDLVSLETVTDELGQPAIVGVGIKT